MKTTGIAYWAWVNAPDTRWDPTWSITLEITKEEGQKLKEAGLSVIEKVNEDDTVTRSFKFTRRVEKRGKNKGQKNKKPLCLDPGLKHFPGVIGNGSEVVVLHRPYDWDHKGRKGRNSDFIGVQILKLVEYVPEVKDEENPEEEGFEVVGESFEKIEGEDEVFPEEEESTDEEEF